MAGICLSCQPDSPTVRRRGSRGYTLVELLVVLGIISLLTAIALSALGKARRRARVMLGMNNQRQIAGTLNLYSIDYDERYPESVATIGFGGNWHWQEPTMLTAYNKRSPGLHRSMGEYLRDYIEDADLMFCPNAPRNYKYLQQSWDAGDQWNNPDTDPNKDPVCGTYCFYWNYVGYLGEGQDPFRGPWGPAGGRRQSKLLVSDYFGYGHWRSPDAYGSCEQFNGAGITEGTDASSAYWSRPASDDDTSPDSINITLHASYIDGHTESYRPSETAPMKVSLTSDGTVPYPDGTGISPGIFYLPENALP